MSTIQRVFWGHMLIGTGGLAIGYAMAPIVRQESFGWLSLLFVFLGALWFITQMRGAVGFEGILLYLYLLAAGLGFMLDAPGWLMLVCGVAALGAWDLDHFLQRLRTADNVDYESGVGGNHIKRLVIVEGLGLLLGLVAITFHASVPLWWEVLLVFLALLSIRALIEFVRKQSQ